MKKKLLQLLIMLSKFYAYGVLAQMILLSLVFASDGNAQRRMSVRDIYITIKMENSPLEDVFHYIEANTDFSFFYDETLIDKKQIVSINRQSSSVADVILDISRQANLQFKQINEVINVNIIPKQSKDPQRLEIIFQARNVTGKVTSMEDGETLPGVNVIEKGTANGTVTGIDGQYSLTVSEGATLVFSFVGFASEEIAVGTRSIIDVSMSPDIQALEEIVVIGYGTIKKSDLTGSVATVSNKDFNKVPASNLLQIIQGMATGLQITAESGMPGASSDVLIRGVQSINGSNSPVFVVDGVITDKIDNLNPNSIESISVLKDASAAAIYGARAANGIILVTTKRGKRNKEVEISLNSYYGFQEESNLKLKLLNADQFIELFTESYENIGMDLLWDQEDLEQYKGVDTNWKDLMLQTGIIHNTDLSLSGGSEKSNYFVSAAYLNQKGMVIQTGYKKYTLNFNADHSITDWIRFGNSLNIYSTSRDGNSDYYASALRQSPLRRAYEDNGDYGIVRNSNLEHIQRNPIWQANETVNNNIGKGLQGSLSLRFDILKGLDFTINGSMDYSERNSTAFSPGVSAHYGWEGSPINSITKGNYQTSHWINEYLLNYDKSFAEDHNIKILMGYSLEESSYEFLTGSRNRTPTNEIRFLDAGDPTSQLNSNGFEDWSFTSLFGRLSYSYKQKYLFTGTIRRDGSSRLSEGTRYGVFPSASVAWRVSEEEFFQGFDFIDDLKFRASYGTLGNILSVGVYGTVPSLENRNAVINQAPATGYTLTAAINKDLKWESVNKKNLGADISLFDSKIYSTVDIFIENTYNLLFNEPIAYSNGLSGTPLINAGEVRNSGFEFEIGHRAHKSDWSYDINFNLSHVHNEVVDLGGRDLRTSGIEEGYPVRSYFGYKSGGLIKDESELSIYQNGTFKTKGVGDIGLLDIDGYDADGKLTGNPDGKIDAADRTIIGNKNPNLIYGALGSVNYKNWGFQVQLQGVQGIDLSIQPYGSYSMLMLMTGWARNEDARVLKRYHPTKNPNGTLPRLTKDDSGHNTATSDFWLVDGSYLRIKNINLSYALPKAVSSKLKLRDFNVFSSIQNAFTFTKYDGPEVDTQQEPTGVPQPRTWTIGFRATF